MGTGPCGLPTCDVTEAKLLTGLASRCQELHSSWSLTAHQDTHVTMVSRKFLWQRGGPNS